jgi:hypothetical protein
MTKCFIDFLGALMRQYSAAGANGFTGSIKDADAVMDAGIAAKVWRVARTR